ncbi:MAG: GT4 family glycosyltransferase PelF [SAR324 cluster bacterium]|nr:GT4 family glycosyltransferase PelF [SAR324 cluster bacterium]
MPKKEPENPYESDVCLILEGTYPYVRGGVSSWVHSLILGLPEFSFSILLILPDRKERKMRYEVPKNVRHLHSVYLQDPRLFKKKKFQKTLGSEKYQDFWEMHTSMPFVGQNKNPETVNCPAFSQITQNLDQKKWSPSSLLFSTKSWDLMLRLYELRSPDVSFTDYYWTWRYLHAGIFSVMEKPLPRCRLYHTISTGYAGLIAARAQILTGSPMLVTEHGIYSKERKIEISRASWIYEKSRERFMAEKEMGAFKQIWINAFRVMSAFCYEQSSEIITLFEGNQRLQMEDGAPPGKLKVIPNGVEYDRISALPRESRSHATIGFAGRVVSIKDVKTFIRAIRLIVNVHPDTKILIMGPTEEEEDYYEECVQLVKNLDLEKCIEFTGNVNLMEYYPKLSVLVLTSISEGQPLVILEAQCLGIPVVASDVGACRELLEGREEDAQLGHSGIVTGLADPEGTALAVISILGDPKKARKMGEAGKRRMKQFYDMPLLFKQYQKLYTQYCDRSRSAAAGSHQVSRE